MTKVIFVALGLAFAIEQAEAQALSDPTRPPDVAEAVGDAPTVSRGPLLQAVLISTQRRYAVIDGRQVGLGTRIGAARIVGITESAVILEGASGRTTLKLLPGVGRATVESASESPEIERKAVRK
jgi:hypothetical protein